MKEARLAVVDLTLLKKSNSRAAHLAVDDAAVFHFVDPIAGFGNCRIVCGEEQRLAAFMHKILQQLKCALGVRGVEIAGRFIGENDARIVRERTLDGNLCGWLQIILRLRGRKILNLR